jgi:RNA polymerase-binding transcription factor DksA
MANFDRQAVEAALERRLEEIRATRAGMHRESERMVGSELAHLDNHPGDEGTETFEQELEAATGIFLTDEERRIEDARRALAAGTYGTCADCGREIAEAPARRRARGDPLPRVPAARRGRKQPAPLRHRGLSAA